MQKIWMLAFCVLLRGVVSAYSIVFVHLGQSLPSYIYFTIAQAHLFNPEASIYLIANQQAIERVSSTLNAICVPCESLHCSQAHLLFKKRSTLDRKSIGGFWFYTSERFFYVEEFIRENGLTDVFHLENDILLYADLGAMLETFAKNYPTMIGATFEQDFRCVPGFLYIPNQEPLGHLVQFMADSAHHGDSDMQAIGKFRQQKGMWIDMLPIVPEEYVVDHHPLRSTTGILSNESYSYCNHFEEFQSVFDAASFGIFVGGDDSAFHADAGPGKIHPNSVVVSSNCLIEWQVDAQLRRIPVLVYKGRTWKINNLHLTNKILLPKFTSVELF